MLTPYSELLKIEPFELAADEKAALLTRRMKELTLHHAENCAEYARVINALGFEDESSIQAVTHFSQLPALSVALFKEFELLSIPREQVFKTMTSSGTTGQAVSKIYLDKATANNQQRTLVRIATQFMGASRMPMLIIDSPSVVKDRLMFSARGAGILGFSIFGADKTYALNDDMQLDIVAVQQFLQRHSGQRILVFGFTFMVWQHFCRELERRGVVLDMSNAILIHGGGWKKLLSEQVSHEEFAARLNAVCGVNRVCDYYGMVEQTGCVYMECECGHLHASTYSDVIIRRPHDFSVADIGERGVIEVVSMLPESYCGHMLITEDEGTLLGEDDCPCGRKGKYFAVHGRIQNAEIRGCSDTYANQNGF